MRSEERAGLVTAILLVLWGTLLTEPFHVFTDYLYSVLSHLQTSMGITTGSVLSGLLTAVILAAICIVLLLLTKTRAAEYIPCGAFCFTGIVLFIRTIMSRTFFVKEAVIVCISLVAIAILHAATLRKALLWVSDFTVLSIPVFLLVALVTKPLGALGKTIGKILYINSRQGGELAHNFAGLFGLPALLWGAFIFILLALPIIYNCISKRRT